VETVGAMVAGGNVAGVNADLKVLFFGRFGSPVFFVSPRSKMDRFLYSWQGQSAAWSCAPPA